jgi:hypothetical protein
MTSLQTIYIKAISRHHGLFITLCGILLLVIVSWLSTWFWQQARLPLMFLVLASFVIIFIGLLKLAEPKHSLILTAHTLEFHHRHGQWKMPWRNVRNIFPVTNTSGFELNELNYLGIRLEHLTDIIPNISRRLANRLIHEQKPLIQYCLRHQLLTLEQSILNFEPYKLDNGEVIKGPLAAFLHHSEQLFNALGAHLFISSGSLNNSITEFSKMLNDYHQAIKKADINN